MLNMLSMGGGSLGLFVHINSINHPILRVCMEDITFIMLKNIMLFGFDNDDCADEKHAQ